MRNLRLIERATGRCLLEKVGVAETVMSRFLGLMGRKGLEPGTALYIPACSSIHMFFMRFAIDAVYVDEELKVRKIVARLRPWRLSWCRAAYGVLEAPAGWAEQVALREGVRLSLEEATGSET